MTTNGWMEEEGRKRSDAAIYRGGGQRRGRSRALRVFPGIFRPPMSSILWLGSTGRYFFLRIMCGQKQGIVPYLYQWLRKLILGLREKTVGKPLRGPQQPRQRSDFHWFENRQSSMIISMSSCRLQRGFEIAVSPYAETGGGNVLLLRG